MINNTCVRLLSATTRNELGSQVARMLSTRPEPAISEAPKTRWLWPVYREMEMLSAAHQAGAMLTGGRFRYNTKQPLQTEHVEEALRHLLRKTPNFRGYLKEHDGRFWVCEEPEPEVDFEVLDGADSTVEAIRMSNSTYDAFNPPQVRSKLIPLAHDTPCVMPEILESFPYQYDLLVQPHHAFVDGTSMAIITGHLVRLLNDVIAGRPIDDSQYGDFINNEAIARMDLQIAKKLKQEPEALEAKKDELLKCDSTPILLKAFSAPGGRPSNDMVHRNLDPVTLASFKAVCKANGVSFNSGFEAIVNAALVKMVTEAGVKDESFDISVNMATDLRRYMGRTAMPVFGLHVRHVVHKVATPFDVLDQFWQHTTTLHHRLTTLLKSGEPLQQQVVRQLTLPQVCPWELYRTGPTVVRDYGMTNIGDVTKMIPGVGEHLQQTDNAMFASTHLHTFPMCHQVYTFRGHSPYTISYDTSYFSRHTVEMLMDTIFDLLKHFSKA